MSHFMQSEKNYEMKRTWSNLNDGKNGSNEKCSLRREDKLCTSRSFSTASMASSSSSEVSDGGRHYPMFTAEYARRFGRSNLPFLRMECLVQQQSSSQLLRLRSILPVTQIQRVPRLILYNEYAFISELGKGTYAKVVLCYSLRTGETCALKVFRGEKYYKEACWDEVAALEVLCQPVADEAGQQQQWKGINYRDDNAETNCNSNCNSGCNNNNHLVASDAGGGVGFYNCGEKNFGVLFSSTFTSFSESQGQIARFNVPILHLPHPIHHAIVFPALGPSLLDILKRIRSAFVKNSDKPTSRFQSSSSTNSTPREYDIPYPDVVDVHYAGMPVDLVRSIIYQILLFLRHAHIRGVVHTDLKPENVLFETNHTLMTQIHIASRRQNRGVFDSEQGRAGKHGAGDNCNRPFMPYSDSFQHKTDLEINKTTVNVSLPTLNSVRVIDLGAAEFLSNCRSSSALDGVTPVYYHRIHTTHYRSAEVLLGLGWTSSTDMWSLGCMIPELLTGDCVFMPRDDLEHLALMEHIIAPFDTAREEQQETSIVSRVFAKGRYFKKFFDPHTMQLLWPPLPNSPLSSSLERERRSGVLEKDVRYVCSRPTLREVLEPFPQLYHLCQRLLDYDPLRRITAAEALEHPFFTTPAC